jgi:hypothetical protein
MPKMKSQAFDLKEGQLTGAHDGIKSYDELAQWICNELDVAVSARGTMHEDIQYAWTLYEQGRTRDKTAPWPDAADLTSPMTAEYVDALHARAMQTIFTEPVWTVEGWADSQAQAPFVEEFHQRAQEEERLQGVLDEVLLRAWIEPAGILEVSEAFELRRERRDMLAQVQTDPTTGGPILGEDAQPVALRNEDGDLVEAQDETMPSVKATVDVWEPVRLGPDYDVIPYLDFYTLPQHARNRTQIWGYAKRFWRRVPELVWRAERGIYDAKAVDAVGEEDESTNPGLQAPTPAITPSQKGPTAQKELFEVQFLANLDGDGERWYRATVHKDKRILFRLKVDDRTTRYIRFVPFLKPGSVDGYSLPLHKLRTVIEEDTAVRNMRADKAALAIAAPIKRTQGALWDPFEQPFGPRAVIDVRDQSEVQQLVLSDVPPSINVWKNDVRVDADRLIGQNDTSLGTETGEDRTLGEVRLRAGYAEVRVDLLVKRLKEPMEELWQARHTIWKRTLATRPMQMKQSLVLGLEARGIDAKMLASDGRITAELLEGHFWGKPRGSVETADINRARVDFTQLLATLPGLLKVNPMLAMLFSTQPAAKSLIEQMLRVFRWPDKQAFLGSEAQAAMQQAMQQQQLMQSPQMQAMLAMAHGLPNQGPPGAGPMPHDAAAGQVM